MEGKMKFSSIIESMVARMRTRSNTLNVKPEIDWFDWMVLGFFALIICLDIAGYL